MATASLPPSCGSGDGHCGPPGVGRARSWHQRAPLLHMDGSEPWLGSERTPLIEKTTVLGAAISAIASRNNPCAEQYRRWLYGGLTPRIARRNVARSQAAVMSGMCKTGACIGPSGSVCWRQPVRYRPRDMLVQFCVGGGVPRRALDRMASPVILMNLPLAATLEYLHGPRFRESRIGAWAKPLARSVRQRTEDR